MPDRPGLTDAFVDLVLGSCCVGCRAPGRPLCPPCHRDLPLEATARWPTPTPPGLVPPYSAAAYEGTLRAMVLAHKERRVLALARPLGDVLAVVVRAALADAGVDPGETALLVPVPSRPAVVRQRGHDPTRTMVERAARALERSGQRVDTARLLRTRPGVLDQSGMDARGRAANLAGSMATSTPTLRRLARRPAVHVVLCDDVLTTGATLREAQRALESVGVRVLAAATVAATRRRVPDEVATPNSG